jgi:predicted nuclease with TOPRIM domain
MNNEKIKISDEFFSEIKMLQGKFQEVFTKLGNVGVEGIELDRLVTEHVEKTKRLKEEWISLQKLEQSLLDKIVQKYGTGNLNMSDGTFTPSEE